MDKYAVEDIVLWVCTLLHLIEREIRIFFNHKAYVLINFINGSTDRSWIKIEVTIEEYLSQRKERKIFLDIREVK